MIEKLKNLMYDLSDYLTTIIIILIIVFSITSIMSSSLGIGFKENENEKLIKKAGEEKKNTEVKKEKEKLQPSVEKEKEQKTDETKTETTTQETKVEPPKPVLETPKDVELVISSGQTARGLADDLFNKNVIKDKDKFLNFLVNNNLDTLIKTGTFKLKEKMQFEEIKNILFK